MLRLLLSIATKMVSAPLVRGILQGGQQVSSTILMYTEKRGRGTILVAIESTEKHKTRATETLRFFMIVQGTFVKVPLR